MGDIYYKLVRNDSGRYCSALPYPHLSLDYSIGKVTAPYIGKIFVFKTINDAEEFIEPSERYSLLKVTPVGAVAKCEARLVSPAGKYVKMFWDSSKKIDGTWESPKQDWWKGYGNNLIIDKEYEYWAAAAAPKGSYIVDAVMPVGVIK
jgi:hypothetical protein